MSGAKQTYVSMRSEEAQRLRSQAQRCDRKETENRILEAQNKQRKKREKDLKNKLAKNEKRYEQHVQRLGKDMQKMEHNTRAEFNRQKQKFQQSLKETALQQQTYTDNRIQQLDNKIQQDLSSQRNEYKSLIEKQGKALQSNIDQLQQSIVNRLHNEQEIAQEWYQALQEETAFIKDNFRYQQFAPTEFADIQERLSLINADMKQQVFQTAIASARDSYLQARKLREKLELLEIQWDSAEELAQESCSAALLLINEHELIDYLLENDESFQLEVDFWSKGQWQILQQQVIDYQQQLNTQQDKLSQTELEHIQTQCVQAQDELLALVEQAKAALLSSIHRRDIQENIAEKLTELGYRFIDSTYEQEDFREAFHLKMENGNQDQIVTIVTPSEQAFTNELSINFFDNSPNEAIRTERLESIRQQITEQDLTMEKMRCEKGFERGNAPAIRQDFSVLRQKKNTSTTNN